MSLNYPYLTLDSFVSRTKEYENHQKKMSQIRVKREITIIELDRFSETV